MQSSNVCLWGAKSPIIRVWTFCVLASLSAVCSSRGFPDDHAALAQRFRPYYKFSVEKDGKQEHTRPCSWQWFVSHSDLQQGSHVVLTDAQLQTDQQAILKQTHGDVRGLPPAELNKPFKLHPAESARDGQPWADVINDGAGLYAQVEEIGNGQVVIVYWLLYAYNQGTQGIAFDHDGDITAVAVVYDRGSDQLARASFVLHGAVVESFDLTGQESTRADTLHGLNASGAAETMDAQVRRIAPGRSYQDGPAWHSPSLPADIFLAKDPASGKFEHLALFIEWGAHELWPNPSGSVTAAPKHNGDGLSFLPARVRFVGSITAPVEAEAPFMFFNGVWGDPPSPVFHRICFDPKGESHPTLGIPDGQMTDRDPYWKTALKWPPSTFVRPIKARISVNCNGDKNGAQVAIRWGHPNHDEHEYFPLWTIKRGETAEKAFELPDDKSEFEIQTEGGSGTSYTIKIWVDKGDVLSSTGPSVVLKHKVDGAQDEDISSGDLGVTRSSKLNEYGEQNIRVDVNGRVVGPIQ